MLNLYCGLIGDMLLEDAESYPEYEKDAALNSETFSDCVQIDVVAEGPDLYTEADEMVESLVLFSSLTELRKNIRPPRRRATVVDRVAHVPITHAEIMNSLTKNQGKLLKRRFSRKDNPVELTKDRPRVTATTILHVAESNQSRFDHSVSVNHQRRRVVVCFQNCELDYENWETRLQEVTNPVQRSRSYAHDRINLHEGFLSILRDGRENQDPWSAFHSLIEEHIRPILERHQGYKIYATGFKNGGALATLFAFYAAAQYNDEIPKPVCLFSFGSPYVGDQAFREEHQHLERLGRLCHLRVVNYMDYTPLTPQISLRFDVFKPMLFKHVGVQLKLYDGLFPPEISCPRTGGGLIGNVIDELGRAWGQSILASMPMNPLEWPDHGLKDYVDRMFLNKVLLQGLSLNQLYCQN